MDYEVIDKIVEDVSVIKNQYQIPNNLRSCHSAQIANYMIEGHVPIESINKLFKENPSINGIAVPGNASWISRDGNAFSQITLS